MGLSDPLANLMAAEAVADDDDPFVLMEAQFAVIFAEFAATAGCCPACLDKVEGKLNLPPGYERPNPA